jgi:GT2 family glycosyltransferase
MFDKSVKYEQGICVDPTSFIYKKFLDNEKRNISILGCNFSCFKKDFEAINGFDEGYGGTALSDDTDLTWRFQAYGAKLRSCKNAANVFHLYHKMFDRGNPDKEIALMEKNKKENRFVCKSGLNTH